MIAPDRPEVNTVFTIWSQIVETPDFLRNAPLLFDELAETWQNDRKNNPNEEAAYMYYGVQLFGPLATVQGEVFDRRQSLAEFAASAANTVQSFWVQLRRTQNTGKDEQC